MGDKKTLRNTEEVLAGRPLKQIKIFTHMKRYSFDSDKASFLI